MLRSLVLLAVVCFAASAEAQAAGGFPGLRSLVEPRLMSSGLRIGRLERLIADLKERIDGAAKIDPKGFVNEINTRLDTIQNFGCDNAKDQRCGRDSSECVSSLLMCDGVKDCHNGWDEDENTCSDGPIAAGNRYSGTATWTHCRLRKDHPVSLQIVGVLKPKFFGSHIAVRARVSANFVDDDSDRAKEFDVKGYYVHGRKRLVLIPIAQDSSAYGVVCHWNRGDDSRAECQLVNEGTLGECAHFFVHRDRY